MPWKSLKVIICTTFLIFLVSCSSVEQSDTGKLLTGGVSEESITEQTAVLTGLNGRESKSEEKREMAKPETDFFPEMPKNKLAVEQLDSITGSNKVQLKSGKTVELLGIQTESIVGERDFVNFKPEQAKKFLEEVLGSQKRLYIEEIIDGDGNLTHGYIWIGNNKELHNVNALLLQEGLAKVVRIDEVTQYDGSFHELELENYRNQVGIWEGINN